MLRIKAFNSFKYPLMVEESKGPKRHMAEELTSRFRSKEDLYRYLTQQGKIYDIDLSPL